MLTQLGYLFVLSVWLRVSWFQNCLRKASMPTHVCMSMALEHLDIWMFHVTWLKK